MTHIMLDLETLGTGNDAVILSIGAVKFDAENIIDRFHIAIDPETCTKFGLKMDASTVMWWLGPTLGEARESLLNNATVDLPSALYGFTDWVGDDEPTIWGNGSTFDNVILRSAYRAVGLDYPTSFRLDHCYRTIRSLAPGIEVDRIGVHHNALDDAEYQARTMQAIMKHLGIPL
jgi:hypothetical protein